MLNKWNNFLQFLEKRGSILIIALSFFVMIGAFATNRDRPKTFTFSPNTTNRVISVQELASWYLENRKDFEVLDMREVDKYKENHIKNAISCPVCHSDKSDAKAKLQASEVVPDFRKKLVLYTQSGDQPLQLPRILARNKRVFMLKGGYNAWNDEIMKPQEYKPEDTQEEFIRKQKQNAISNYFQGKMDIQVPEKTVKKIPRKKHVISSGPDEGC